MIQNICFKLLLLFLLNISCYADSIPAFFPQENFQSNYSHFELLPDTGLTGFQIYLPIFAADPFPRFSGNLGGVMINANRNTELYHQQKSGLNALGQNEFSPYNQQRNLLQNRYSKLNYSVGSKQMQLLKIMHHQRVAKGFTAGVDFNVSGSPGFYTRQHTKQRNFDLFTIYNTINNRYKLEAHYISNRLESEENGGIINDSLFINAENIDANLVGINLNDASVRFQNRFYSLEQSFGIKALKDSNNQPGNLKQYHWRLHHKILIERTHRLFEVNSFSSNYFNNFFRDSLSTKDSLFLRNYIHEAGLTHFNAVNILNSRLLQYRLFTRANRHDYRYYSYDKENERIMYDLSVGGELDLNHNFGAFILWNKGIENSDQESLELRSSALLFKGKAVISLGYKRSSSNPDLISNYYSGNHFKWENDFSDIHQSGISVELSLNNHFLINATRKRYENFIYYDNTGIPQQYKPELFVDEVNLIAKQKIGKLNFREQIRLRDTDKPGIVRVPEFASYFSTFYEGEILKSNFPVQIGLDWRYNTSYFELQYNPATMQFQVQDNQEIGNYLYVDLFFNFKIRTALIFIKIEHINEGLTNRNYFLLPYQPMPGRAFRFGLEWRFND